VAQAMLERQPPPAGQVGVDDLNIGIARGRVILVGKQFANPAVSPLIVDRLDLDERRGWCCRGSGTAESPA